MIYKWKVITWKVKSLQRQNLGGKEIGISTEPSSPGYDCQVGNGNPKNNTEKIMRMYILKQNYIPRNNNEWRIGYARNWWYWWLQWKHPDQLAIRKRIGTTDIYKSHTDRWIIHESRYESNDESEEWNEVILESEGNRSQSTHSKSRSTPIERDEYNSTKASGTSTYIDLVTPPANVGTFCRLHRFECGVWTERFKSTLYQWKLCTQIT